MYRLPPRACCTTKGGDHDRHVAIDPHVEYSAFAGPFAIILCHEGSHCVVMVLFWVPLWHCMKRELGERGSEKFGPFSQAFCLKVLVPSWLKTSHVGGLLSLSGEELKNILTMLARVLLGVLAFSH